MGTFYCHGCETYKDSKCVEEYFTIEGNEYCSNECAGIKSADELDGLSIVGCMASFKSSLDKLNASLNPAICDEGAL